jgi:UDP-N-acetylglucosamine 4,6-dehydratase/5-epimerase
MFSDRVLPITGGRGSFGKAVLKRFLASDLRELAAMRRSRMTCASAMTTRR